MKGILFKPDMHQAERDGIKTVTRRLITKHNSEIGEGGDWDKLDFYGEYRYRDGGQKVKAYVDHGFPNKDGKRNYSYLHVPYNFDNDEQIFRVYSRFEPEQILYIKEAHYTYGHWTQFHESGKSHWEFFRDNDTKIHFVLDGKWAHALTKPFPKDGWYLRSPLFLEATDARDFIQIVDVRPERIQDITEEDALKEGIKIMQGTHQKIEAIGGTGKLRLVGEPEPFTARYHYECLWRTINGDESWDKNFWCWRIEFRRIDKPQSVEA